ncbi:MAG: VWA domain-containing protein [Hyphomicrobiales bacterium]
MRTRGWRHSALGLLLTAIAAGAGAPAALAAEKPRLLFIFDASRSMWGQIDGVNKVVSARNAIASTAARAGPKMDIGLLAFGHRQASGCKDIEMLTEIGEYSKADFEKALDGIKPKGSTPIAESMKEAANAVERGHVVVLADGLDNCGGDPCTAADLLGKESPNVVFHVVGFDKSEKGNLAKLQCAAEPSGGSFAVASNEGELRKALDAAVDKAMKWRAAPKPLPPVAAAPQPAAAPAPVAAPAPQATAPVPAAPAGKSQVELRAYISEGGASVASGLVWRIFDPKPDKDGKYELLGTLRDPVAIVMLEPGDYLVNAAYGLSHVTKKITVAPGQPLRENLILNTGGLRLNSILPDGQQIPPGAVRYDIFSDETDQFGNRKKVLGSAKPGIVIRLNAGVYHIVSVYGDANAVAEADVTIEPARLSEATVTHTAARVTLKLVHQPGGEALAGTQWQVLTPGGDVVKESVGALPTHILAAGDYSVLAKYNGSNFSRDFSVKAGEVAQVELVVR